MEDPLSQLSGAIYLDKAKKAWKGSGDTDADNYRLAFQAKKSNTTYGKNTLVQPKAFQTLTIIKV